MDNPKRPPSHPDYALDCEEALEEEVDRVITAAIEAGWSESAVFAAVHSLSVNIEQARIDLAVVERQILAARGEPLH